MANHSKKFLALLFSVFLVWGCTPKNVSTTKSQLEVRQIQTKVFQTDDYRGVLKAVLNILQDDGYIIDSVNDGLGFLKAQKEIDVESRWRKIATSVFSDDEARWAKLNIIEVSCNVTQFGNKTKVRANFRSKLVSNRNEVINSYQVEDENFYRDFFSKVDKSIFLEEEGI